MRTPLPGVLRSLRPLLLAALVGAAGCGEGLQPAPRIGDPVPEFSAPMRLTGDTTSFAELRGSPALINLWATWCPPCRSETPYLQLLADRLGPAGLQVVGVTTDVNSARESVDRFLASVDASYPQMMDPRSRTTELFGVIGLPATFVVDSEGIIRYLDLGPVDDGDPRFAEALRSVLPAGTVIPSPDEVEGADR